MRARHTFEPAAVVQLLRLPPEARLISAEYRDGWLTVEVEQDGAMTVAPGCQAPIVRQVRVEREIVERRCDL